MRITIVESSIFISLLIFLSFFGAGMTVMRNMELLWQSVGEKVEVVVFLKDGLKDIEIKKIQGELYRMENVKKIRYESKLDALKEFLNDPELAQQVKIVGENPLPALLRIQVKEKSPEKVSAIAKAAGGLPNVEDVRYGEEETLRLERVNRGSKLSAYLFGSIMGAGLLLSFFMTCGIAGRFLKVPFNIVFGAWIGMASSITALVILYCGYLILKTKIFRLVFLSPAIIPTILILGIFIGIAGIIIFNDQATQG